MKKILTLFLVLIFVNLSLAQNEPNDCVNAITVCGNGNFISNASGEGDIQEVSGCSGFEHNSLWLKINVIQSGSLGFDIIPKNTSISVDYDFWVFAANKDCSNLGSPVRCATTNPNLAGMSDNHTGMNGATTLTQTGPGASGNGYVRWLTVAAGQSYYIAIDRPVGDGGFELAWTGTATLNGGAFATPPVANSISDYKTCSSTPNVGIFDLNTVRSQVNPDLVTNTVTFYETLANAVDGISALPNIISNTSNPQIIYARVTNNTTGCNSISNFNLAVYPVPSASLSVSKSVICSGDEVTATFSGTPTANIEYKIDGGTIQSAVLDATGIFEIKESLTADRSYSLVSAKIVDNLGNTVCAITINDTKKVSVNALPTANISGTTPICYGTKATITFNGTPNSIITYTVDGGANQTIPIDATGTATITSPVLTINSTFTLVSITSSVGAFCSQNLTDSLTISITPLPTATISGTTPICIGNTSEITFKGTPDATITYKIDSGVNKTIVLDATGTANLTTPQLTSSSIYSLIDVVSSGPLVCTNNVSDFITININPLPTATISGTKTICSGASTKIDFSGTDNSTVTYKINGSANQIITLNALGTASLITPPLTATTIYELVSVNSLCLQPIIGSATVTILPLPTVQISGSATVCLGASTTIDFVGTPNATVIYTINNGSNQSIVLDGLGFAKVSTGSLTGNTLYSLVSSTSAGIPSCSQSQTGSVTVAIGSSSVIIANPELQTICSGETTNIALSSNIGATFSWTATSVGVTGAIQGNGNTIAQKLTTAGITQGTVTYSISLITNGCAGLPKIVTVIVTPSPRVLEAMETKICSGEYTNIELLADIPETTFEWTVIPNKITGATSSFGDINNQFLETIGTAAGTATYKIIPTANGCKGSEINRIVNVNPLPVPLLSDGVLCIDVTTGIPSQVITFDTGLNNVSHDFVWFFNGNRILGANDNRYQTNKIGNYEVIATNTETGCISLVSNAKVKESNPGLEFVTTQTPSFSENATILATVIGGNGIYEFQLDNEPYQLSDFFTNVSPGQHTITVRDTNGCTNLSKKVLIIGYPKFFTPNGDGVNDTWNIIGLEKDPRTKIYIYDRYGKLIHQIKYSSSGWDGTYNRQSLPSTDYWFTIEYYESGIGKLFKSHFAMKR